MTPSLTRQQFTRHRLERVVLTRKLCSDMEHPQYTAHRLEFLNKTTNRWFGGWFLIQEFSNKLFLNELIWFDFQHTLLQWIRVDFVKNSSQHIENARHTRLTFVVHFHNKYALILSKTHHNTLKMQGTLDWLL